MCMSAIYERTFQLQQPLKKFIIVFANGCLASVWSRYIKICTQAERKKICVHIMDSIIIYFSTNHKHQ